MFVFVLFQYDLIDKFEKLTRNVDGTFHTEINLCRLKRMCKYSTIVPWRHQALVLGSGMENSQNTKNTIFLAGPVKDEFLSLKD